MLSFPDVYNVSSKVPSIKFVMDKKLLLVQTGIPLACNKKMYLYMLPVLGLLRNVSNCKDDPFTFKYRVSCTRKQTARLSETCVGVLSKRGCSWLGVLFLADLVWSLQTGAALWDCDQKVGPI